MMGSPFASVILPLTVLLCCTIEVAWAFSSGAAHTLLTPAPAAKEKTGGSLQQSLLNKAPVLMCFIIQFYLKGLYS